ncbi:MAG: GNAT family N-acetyltransferase [Solobacterium sp.]|nr:GNAT family N-acetyltransferase [Solobacterium sp.]
MEYECRKMTVDQAGEVLELYRTNPQYFVYCPPEADPASVKRDLTVYPPGCTADQKHSSGFYEKGKLIAFLDLITDFPEKKQAYIGLFMVRGDMHHKGIGSRIIRSLCADLEDRGFISVSLGYVKNNVPAEMFWKKNGFIPNGKETETGQYTVCAAEKSLQGRETA